MRDHQLIVIVFVAAGIALIAWVIWLERRDDKRAEQRRWAASTRVTGDVTATRRSREIARLYEIWPDPPQPTIPSQTRRPRKDQP